MVDLQGTFLTAIDDSVKLNASKNQLLPMRKPKANAKVPLTRDKFVVTQEADDTLKKCFLEAQNSSQEVESCYTIIKDVLFVNVQINKNGIWLCRL